MNIYDPLADALGILPNPDFDYSNQIPHDTLSKCPPTPGMTGLKHSDETKKLLSSIRKGRKPTWKVTNNWDKKRIYTCEWEVIEPNGSVIIIDNLKRYCRDKNLNMGNLTHYGKAKGYSVKKLGKSQNLEYLRNWKL